MIAIRGDEGTVAEALVLAKSELDAPRSASGEAAQHQPKTLVSAADTLPNANLALISVPGASAIAEARKGMAEGKFSSVELTQSCVDAMEARADLGAYITPTPEAALEAAAVADKKRAAGDDGALLGIPLGIICLFFKGDVGRNRFGPDPAKVPILRF